MDIEFSFYYNKYFYVYFFKYYIIEILEFFFPLILFDRTFKKEYFIFLKNYFIKNSWGYITYRHLYLNNFEGGMFYII